MADRWVDTEVAEAAAVVRNTVGCQAVEIQLARIAEVLRVARIAAGQAGHMETHTAGQVAQAAADIEADHMHNGCRTVASPVAVPCHSPWDMASAVSAQVGA